MSTIFEAHHSRQETGITVVFDSSTLHCDAGEVQLSFGAPIDSESEIRIFSAQKPAGPVPLYDATLRTRRRFFDAIDNSPVPRR